jgi:hypothetical protein
MEKNSKTHRKGVFEVVGDKETWWNKLTREIKLAFKNVNLLIQQKFFLNISTNACSLGLNITFEAYCCVSTQK